VYSGHEDGFSEQERAALGTLGSVAGFAIHAIRREDLLVADTHTEVTLEVRDGTVPFVVAAREAGGACTLDGAVPRGDGAVVCYLTPDGDPESVAATLEVADPVSGLRWIREDDSPLVEVTVDGETPVTTLAAWGGTVRTAEYTAESATLVVETVDETVAETTLLAKTETTRSPEPVEAFRDSLAERLTDRQQTVMRAAYLADYFASPRGSTSEEVAASLDITGPTVLHHLRRAQRKLVEAFFDATAGSPPTDES
jgi:predicted DNA binding protein